MTTAQYPFREEAPMKIRKAVELLLAGCFTAVDVANKLDRASCTKPPRHNLLNSTCPVAQWMTKKRVAGFRGVTPRWISLCDSEIRTPELLADFIIYYDWGRLTRDCDGRWHFK